MQNEASQNRGSAGKLLRAMTTPETYALKISIEKIENDIAKLEEVLIKARTRRTRLRNRLYKLCDHKWRRDPIQASSFETTYTCERCGM